MDTWYIQYFHNTVKYRIKQEVAKVTLISCTKEQFQKSWSTFKEKTGISWAGNLIAEMPIYQCLKKWRNAVLKCFEHIEFSEYFETSIQNWFIEG